MIRQDQSKYSIPLEDIGVLLVEEHSVTLTAALLDACIQHKIAFFACDEKHIPSGTMLGYQQHSRQSGVIMNQIRWSEPFKKRLWQKIIQQKISNQQKTLHSIKKCLYPQMANYLASVQSGDPTNREAVAAKLYFSELFPKTVTRGSDHVCNHALNYGYAILRGAIARSIVAYGFLSSIGIQHRSTLNNFALADDLIEPFRPCVDYFVFSKISKEKTLLTTDMKHSLVELLTNDIQIGGRKQTVLRAMEIAAQSLVSATVAKDATKLLLPEISYE